MIELTKISAKWQQKWGEAGIFRATQDPKKRKCYVLEMYPYPSASYLHMGHVRNYTIGDVYARYKRMSGYNVLYPMGYDSFGLPAETAAKKEGVHPRVYTDRAIKKIMEYQKALGNSYDWDRTIASHDVDYYRWNQYFFVKFFERGLVYRKKAPVNWCPTCESTLANEEAEAGRCWRCDSEVIKKDLEQWFFRITAYADRLLEDLSKIDWPEKIKLMQTNWIGKSYGTEIDFTVNDEKWPVFTTRPDTLFGVTFMVISAQHPRLMELTTIEHKKEVEGLINKALRVRTQEEIEALEKEGAFTGAYAINPINGEKIPVYAGNFVIADYGCGMVMGVPAHDDRDYEFATKYNLPIIEVVRKEGSEKVHCYTEDGYLINSKEFTGLDSNEAKEKIVQQLESLDKGRKKIQYKIRDWMISRQRYWGTPIPIIHCEKCGVVPVPYDELPVLLPEDVDFNSTRNPLAASKEFVEVKCPRCGGPAKRDTDTMGGFMDSSWYFLRYCDNKSKDRPFDPAKVKYWMPVDQYIGGAEHAVMHLLYARFFIKALKDMGIVEFDEPFTHLFNQGIVYKDGAKMSKSKGNVVYQTDISDKYGIDTARLFLMFIAAPDRLMEWSDQGVEGAYRFLNRVIALMERERCNTIDRLTSSKLNRTINEVTENIENFQYNKGIISIMDFTNHLAGLEKLPAEALKTLALMLSSFTPHLSEEMWELLGEKPFISLQPWPKADLKKIDPRLEAAEQAIIAISADITKVIGLAKISAPREIRLIISPSWKYDFYKKLKIDLDVTRDMKMLMGKYLAEPSFTKHSAEISKIIPAVLKDQSRMPVAILSQEEEHKLLDEASSKIKEQFKAQVIIEFAEKSRQQKALNGMPGKPAIVVA
jgi:leucyl-tRNA synthetase